MKFSEAPCHKLLLVVISGVTLKKGVVGFKWHCDGEHFYDICNLTIYRNINLSCEVELVNDGKIHLNVKHPTIAHVVDDHWVLASGE